MDALSPWHILLILLVVVLLFGGRKIPELMKGLGEGVKEFKKASQYNSENDKEKQSDEDKKESANLPKK
ncbi:MAG TPA: twin-arginine translocase TatA/TatE family subunit [Bacteroidales bacterium]|nr:twin-arginine translocase TatA/TatE family subunit [Bacteroidales bacterium]